MFTDALGDEPLDDEAGTELEEMGEGLEGEELEDEDETPEAEAEAAPEGEEPAQEKPEAEPEEAEGEEAGEQPPPAPEPRPQPSIPPRVLREAREQWRVEADELRALNRDLQMRLDNLSRQPAPQPPPQPAPQPAPPDQFADPQGYTNWIREDARREAERVFNERFAQQQQQQQRDMEMRLNDSLAQTASGPRSYEFNVAYRDLTSLDRTPENAALVRRLAAQPDPGQAILDWWELSSNPDYVEAHREIVRQTYAASRPQRGGPQRQSSRVPMQNGQTPRHEVRLPRSLSEASGGRSQHISDAEMSDGSEESVFAYGARR